MVWVRRNLQDHLIPTFPLFIPPVCEPSICPLPAQSQEGVTVGGCLRGTGCSISLIISLGGLFLTRKGRAGSRKMISTDLPQERAAKPQPTPTALAQRGLGRILPQDSSVLLTWKGFWCRPRRARSPKHHLNRSKRASAWCTAGRWVRAALPSWAFMEPLHGAVLRGWGVMGSCLLLSWWQQ